MITRRLHPGPQEPVRLLVSDADGRVYDHPDLLLAGDRGGGAEAIPVGDLIPLPRGSDLFGLPGRRPIGLDPLRGTPVVLDEWEGGEARAVATFLSPAHTGSDLVAYRTIEGAPALPTYAYTAVGFADDRYWASAIRVDPDVRQEPWRFSDPDIRRGVEDRGRELPGNQVVEQLERCALEYKCRAAQNYFLARHEAPLPVSVACNAQCVGCISLQPDGTFRASHERLMTAPTPEALADLALGHLERVPDGVVSFGQGCEGEPLLVGEVLIAATRGIRERTERGTINLNTNASKPEVVRELVAAGLDSIRASLNSPRPDVYRAYYQPRGYGVDEVVESLRIVHEAGGHTSINLLYFPGVTDTEDERRALAELIETTGLDLVQMRNLNIDPELYRQIVPPGTVSRGRGVRWLLAELSEQFPDLRFGYFNPPLTSPSRGWAADDDRS